MRKSQLLQKQDENRRNMSRGRDYYNTYNISAKSVREESDYAPTDEFKHREHSP